MKVSGGEFKLSEDLLSRYSSKLRHLVEHAKQDIIAVNEADQQSFTIVAEFLNMHKEKEPAKIATPIKTNQSLAHIMEE